MNFAKAIDRKKFGWNFTRTKLYLIKDPMNRQLTLERLYQKYSQWLHDDKFPKFSEGALAFLEEYDQTKNLPAMKEYV